MTITMYHESITKETFHKLTTNPLKQPSRIVIGWGLADGFMESIVGPHRMTRDKIEKARENYWLGLGSPFKIGQKFDDEGIERMYENYKKECNSMNPGTIDFGFVYGILVTISKSVPDNSYAVEWEVE